MEFVVRLSDLEARVAQCVEPLIGKEGYELVKIKANSESGHNHLAFFIDRQDRANPIKLEDLEFLNRLLSDVLDVADAEKPFFKQSYNLEVSSPGVERPLTKMNHFLEANLKKIKIKTDGLESVPRSATGILNETSEDGITIETSPKGEIIFVPFARLKDAHEVFDFSALESKKAKGAAKKSKGEK